MSRFLLCATFGLCLLQLCLAEIQFNISCRYGGVFHVEKNRRYSLTRDEAVELCKALNSTLPTMDQMKKAHNLGFETCRYGYIEDKIVIPRIKPYFLCAANNTGIYILTSNITDRYDTYCYNASETREKACEPIIRLDVSGHDNQSQIVIDNADGSRYTDGVKHTDPTPVTDDNHVGSGSIHDGDATNPTIIGPHMTGASYYEDITPDALSTDYSSGSGRKEDHPTSTNDIATPFDDKWGEDSTVISLITDGVPGKDSDHPSKGRHPASTTVVVSSEGAKNEDATQDPLLHNVYLGVDEDEDKYPINTTVDSVKPAHFPVKERDHSSSSVTVNNEIGRNTYTPTVVVSNEGAKNEDPTQDPLLNGAHPGWSDKVKYSTNTTRNGVLPGVIPSHESEQSTTAMVSNGEAKHEDSTQDPLLHTVHPGWGNADKYPTNVTRNDVLPGIIPPSENDQEKESSHTAVTSNDGAIYEDSTHDSLPLDNQPEWGSEDKYPTNTSRDYVIPGLIPENEAESYTAVVSNDGATHEDSTQDPLLHSVHPGWGNEDKYLTATSRDDVLPGMIPPSETEHKNDSSHTAVVSNDGIKHEDSTKDPLTPGIHLGGENEDKYPTNNPIDNLIPGVFSDIESGHGRGPASTVTSSTLNKHDGRRANPSGQVTKPNIASQPRSAQIPEWLIIVASLLALTLILAVCIAVNSRSRCGQKKKLVINNGKGSVSDKKMGGLNGEASKSQEMVHLVHKEQPDNRTGSCDEFLTTDETKNPQEANMKTGM
ncbi:CD44 antigen isoform X2 [Gopherus flavomarginatus]|uniref:CD44 antigen isoform X2 n=1 Tax=Gopherus flavomarginatus TaxID=286002 RepID=UPI0021CBFD32|nr:CD44 antigen isoform X2 [Gopherus flavomarginatus]